MELLKIIAGETISDGPSNKVITGTGRLNEEISSRPVYQQVGFTSLPKSGTRHIGLIQGNQITVVAGTDNDSDRPDLNLEGAVAIYYNKDNYVMIKPTGEGGASIEGKNDNGIFELKANGQFSVNGGNLTVEV